MDYDTKNFTELKNICKEKGIKGYSSKQIQTKKQLIDLIMGNIIHNDLRKKENWSENKIKVFEKSLSIKRQKNNLYDFLNENYPDIIPLFDGNENDMKKISKGTMVKYKWKCINYKTCSNIFESRPRDLYRDEDNRMRKYCNECAKQSRIIIQQQKMLNQNGSLQQLYPKIIDIWSEDNTINPNNITAKSHKTVKLKCPNKSASHPEYNIKIYNIQESNCSNCPKCRPQTSKAEMRIYSELKMHFKDVKWQNKIGGWEADIIIEDIKLVIEIDGYPWHLNKNDKDLKKNCIFQENGYTVLRIRDVKLHPITCDSIIFDIGKISIDNFNEIVKWINTKYKLKLPINSEYKNEKYFNSIQKDVMNVKYEESIEYLFPKSKEIWDYEKNNPFLPSHFTRGSHTEVWVKCNQGHSFKKEIKLIFRIIKGNKKIILCPNCPKTNDIIKKI